MCVLNVRSWNLFFELMDKPSQRTDLVAAACRHGQSLQALGRAVPAPVTAPAPFRMISLVSCLACCYWREWGGVHLVLERPLRGADGSDGSSWLPCPQHCAPLGPEPGGPCARGDPCTRTDALITHRNIA